MSETQIVKSNNRNTMFGKFALIALAITVIMAFFASIGILPVFAGNVTISTGALDQVMNVVITVIGKAALYIGIVIVLWGVFQIVLAFRREDSEGISKQITTVVVGGVLITFGALANTLYALLVQEGNNAG